MQVELSEALADIGVEVDHLSAAELDFRRPTGRLSRLLHNPHPSSCALRATRREAARFDVVDAHQTLLPVGARAIGSRGIVVIRSSGTPMTYAAFERAERKAGRRETNPATSFVHARRRRRAMSLAMRSYRAADLAIVLNRDEEQIVRQLRQGRAVARIPVGVPRDHLEALARAAQGSEGRATAKVVAFLGSWDRRKGAGDWAQIVREVWSRDADVRFRFMGTGVEDATLARTLDAPVDGERIQHVRSFDPSELPEHLSDAGVLASPSYVEGFPIVTVEAAGAGIPTVGYDTTGTREFPSRLPGDGWLVRAGDSAAMAEELVRALYLDVPARDALAEVCRSLAAQQAWDVLAQQTLRAYESALA